MMLLKFVAGLFIFVALSLWLGRGLMRRVLGDRRDPTPQERAGMLARQGPQERIATQRPPPASPIALKPSRTPWWHDLAWVLGLWFGAVVLLGDPELLWTRWLAWPAAVLMLLGSLFPVVSAWAHARAGLVASASGIDYRDGTGLLKRLSWHQVGSVRLMRYHGRRATRQGLNAPTSRVLERETLLLLDKAGATLLEVDAPLRPAFEYAQFLDAVPAWAGVPVTTLDQDR